MAVGDEAKVGATSWLVYQQETTYGTDAVTTTAFKMLQPLSVGLKTAMDSKKLDELAVNRGYSRRVQLNKSAAGSVEMFADADEQVLLWANALGGLFTYQSLTSASLFSITTGNWGTNATGTSMTFVSRKGDSHLFRYVGGVVNTLKLSAKVGEPAKLVVELVFQDGSHTASEVTTLTSALSYSSAAPFTFVDGTYAYQSTDVLADTTTAREPIQSFELEINNNLVSDDAARQLGTRLLSRRPPGARREVKLKATQRFDTTTALDRFIQATQGAVDLLFVGATISAEYQRRMEIRIPKVFLNSPDPEISGPGVIEMQLDYDVVLEANPGTTTTRDLGLTIRSGRTINV